MARRSGTDAPASALPGTTGRDDIPLPRNVRRYYYASTPHGGGAGTTMPLGSGFVPGPRPPAAGLMLAANPSPDLEMRRALFLHLIDWVTKGTKPPDSAYPRLSDRTLVEPNARAMKWPKIPGAPTPDNVINVLMDYDYGPDFRYNDQSGVMTNVVPPIRQIIPTLAVKIDEDGNEIAGLRSVLVQAPLGTYTGWNPVASGALRGKLNFIDAGYIPFVVTKAERTAAGDPRPSVEERYGSQEGYNCLVRHAAKNEVRKRFLLPEDADRLIAEAAAAKVLPSDPDNRIAKRLCKEIDRDDDHHGGRDHGNRGHDRHHRHGEY